jgi:hypothetical protein
MHPTRTFIFACLFSVMLVAFSGQAFASNTAVGLCSAAGTHYTTIQAAVTAAEALATPRTVRVCPGTYTEQVVLTDSLTLEGVTNGTNDLVVITPPSGGVAANTTDVCPGTYSAYCTNGTPIAAQILVENTTGVTISNLTVDGFGNQLPVCSSTDLMGILFQNASGIVDHVAARNEVTGDTVNGCQTGKGIYIESSTGSSTVTVENSSVHNYSKNGITARYPGTTLTATGNYVQGSGIQTNGAAQNGIELAFGASGTITTNNVIDNVWFCPETNAGGNGCTNVSSASDILLYDAESDVSNAVNTNVVGNSNIPIGLETGDEYGSAERSDGVYVKANKVFGTGYYDAIDLCSNGNDVTGNVIFNSAESGIHVDGGCTGTTGGDTVTGNIILETACAGILVDSSTTSNTTTPNTYYTVPFTIASSNSSCSIPAFGGAVAHAKTTHAKVRSAP